MWAFIHHTPTTSYLLDCEEWNDNLAAFSAEYDGNLNEQNWSADVLEDAVAANQTAMSLAIQAYNNKTARDPHDAETTGLLFLQDETWKPVENTRLSWVSRGGKVLVICSFQLHVDVTQVFQTGLNFALELDGQVMNGSLLGSGDMSNDFIDGGGGLELDDLDFDDIPEFSLNYGTSPSFRGEQTPHQVSGVFDVDPGEHTVQLVARNLKTAIYSVQYFTNRETLVLDGWC